jgi:predicted esterase
MAESGEVYDLLFPSRHTPAAAVLPSSFPRWCIGFARLVSTPWREGKLLSLASTFRFGGALTADKARSLGSLFSMAYRDIACHRAFHDVRSAVPYCLSTQRPTQGHAFLYRPSAASSESPVIVLLHGYGGNLLFTMHAIVCEFPGAVIVAPSWQINWSDGPIEHRTALIEDALSATSQRLQMEVSRPWLFGVSQGGIAAFLLASARPDMFAGLVGISTYARFPAALCLPRAYQVRIVHGIQDDRIPIDSARQTVQGLLASGCDAKIDEIADADHWLLLSHRSRLGEFLRAELPCLVPLVEN